MTSKREDIFVALHRALEEKFAGRALVTRRFYTQDNAPDLPIVMVLEGDESVAHDEVGYPGTWTLEAEIHYLNRVDGRTDDAPCSELHAFLDALEEVIEPGGVATNLDGAVEWCRFAGAVVKLPAEPPEDLIDAVVVPLEIRAV